MARRNSNSVVLSDGDWATLWQCGCGYANTGREHCLICGTKAPSEVQHSAGLHVEQELIPHQRREEDPHAGRRATRTVVATVGVNLALQVLEAAGFAVAGTSQASAIRISLFTGLAYYGLVGVWVLARSASLGLRPRLGLEKFRVGLAEGVIVGTAMAVLLVAIMRIVAGHPVLDPATALLAGQGSVAALVLGFLAIVVAAPLIEELIFRGFLAESLRHRGKKFALLVSAAAFSLAHLRLAQFRYYLVMGLVIGLVYWRRGLVGSVATHAAFNGMLLVVAVTAAHGPAVDFSAAGATGHLPATYRVAKNELGQLFAVGPLGSRIELTHVASAGVPPASALASALGAGAVQPPPGISVDYRTVTVFDLPAGPSVAMVATIDGSAGRVVLIPTPHRLWVASLQFDGSSRASFDFDDMLRSLRLPTT